MQAGERPAERVPWSAPVAAVTVTGTFELVPNARDPALRLPPGRTVALGSAGFRRELS